jgi:hypothetical protein
LWNKKYTTEEELFPEMTNICGQALLFDSKQRKGSVLMPKRATHK